MELLRRLPVWTVAAMVALVPLATGNLTGLGIGTGPLLYDTIALPRLVIALVLTLAAWALWLAYAARDGEQLRVDIVWGLLGGLVAWTGISTAFSPHRALAVLGQSERLEGLVTIALFALLYGLALQVVRKAADARIIITALASAAGLLALYGLAQYVGFDPADYALEQYDFAGRAFATFGNPNFLAGLLVLALPLPGALALGSKSRPTQIAWMAVSIVVIAAIFVTFTRGAWIASLIQVALGVVVWRHLTTGSMSRAMRTLLGLGLVVVAVLFAMSLTARGDLSVVDRVTDALSGVGSANERSLLVPISWEAALERPLTGYGPDAFLPAFRQHRSDDYVIAFSAQDTMNNAHSWPLQYAVTLGIPGALLLITVLGAGIWRARRVAFAPKAGEERQRGAGEVLMAAAWVSCVGFAVHMLFNVAVPGSVVPFWVLLGLAGAPLARSVTLRAPVAWAAAGVGVFVTVAVLAASTALISADASYLASRNAFRGIAQGEPIELAERARARNPLSVKYARGLAEARMVRASAAITAEQPAEEVRALHDAAAAEFDWLLRQSPNDYAGLAWLASLQVHTGVYLEDPILVSQGQATAQRAADLDRQGEEVLGLALGNSSAASIEIAAGVWPLP
ncbi:MAG: O-antigen ligase family protein [Coriobacteriia bacterium]|nr:O-antigen ligase family protein [Coriobacteriia bacterium]